MHILQTEQKFEVLHFFLNVNGYFTPMTGTHVEILFGV